MNTTDSKTTIVNGETGNKMPGDGAVSVTGSIWDAVQARQVLGFINLTVMQTPIKRLSILVSTVLLIVGFLLFFPASANAQGVPWIQQSVGSGSSGSYSYTASTSTYTVNGTSAGIGGSNDSCSFVSSPASGNIEIIARVSSLSPATNNYATGGLMVRDSMNANGEMAVVALSINNGVNFTYRSTDGGATSKILGPTLPAPTNSAPIWLRLVVSGPTIASYESPDGETWALVSSTSMSMPANFYVGMVASSNSENSIAATFSNVSYMTNVPQRSSSMLLWLRGDAGVVSSSGNVSSWIDQSGNGNSVTASGTNQPTYETGTSGINGVPALQFNGTSNYMTIGSGFANFTAGATIFIVAKPTAISGSSNNVLSFGNGAANNTFGFIEGSPTTTILSIYSGSTASAITWSTGLTVNQPQLFEAVQNGSSNGSLYTNGVAGTTGSVNNIVNITRADNYIGQYSGGGYYYQGQIAEILVLNAAMTTAQRQSVEAYIYSKYGTGSPSALSSPIITPGSIVSSRPVSVTISAASGSTIYYTTDGSIPVPGQGTTQYYNPNNTLTVSQTTTINAIATEPYYITGASTAFVQIDPTTTSVSRTGMALWLKADSGVIQSGTQSVTVSGSTITTGNVLTISVSNAELTGGLEAVPYTIPMSSTLTSIATGMAAAINSDAKLNAIGVTATSSSATVAMTSTSPNNTYYQAYTNVGASETLVLTTSVQQWDDMSGAGVNATQTTSADQPSFDAVAVNGLPALTLNGSSQYLALGSGFANFTSGASIFVVAKPTFSSGQPVLMGFGTGAGVTTNGFYLGLQTTGPLAYVWNGTSASDLAASTGTTQNQFQTFEEIQNGAGNATLFTNGASDAQGALDNIVNTTRSYNTVGQFVTSQYFNGQIAEVLVYNRALGQGERQAVEQYLTQRWLTPPTNSTTPVIMPGTGVYSSAQTVSIPLGTGYTVYYTTDGSTPTNSSTPYNGVGGTGPFTISTSSVVQAVSYSGGSPSSSVATAYIEIDPSSAPVSRNGLTLWYRPNYWSVFPDAAFPWIDASGSGYSGSKTNDFWLNPNSINGYTATSNIEPPPAYPAYLTLPTGFGSFNGVSIFALVSTLSSGTLLDFSNGAANNNLTVQNSGSSSSITIYNGSSSSSLSVANASTAYELLEITQNGSSSGTISVLGGASTTGTLNAPNSISRAQNHVMGDCSSCSTEYSGELVELLVYNRTLSVTELAAIQAYFQYKFDLANIFTAPLAPAFSVPAGNLTQPTAVAITGPQNTLLYFTLNGSTPNAGSQLYTGPINISYSQTLKAIAVSSQSGITSSVASAAYTLNASEWPAPSTGGPALQIQLNLPTNAH